MKRLVQAPRPDWQRRVEDIGLVYHSHEEGPYWDESVAYELTEPEVLRLENAAGVLHRLCIDAAEQVIVRGWWDRLHIPEAARPLILASWERDDFSLYGRFDLAFDGIGEPRLLEYNADTPTSLLEASVAQWFWLQDLHPDKDQFNSIHERLIEAWRRFGSSRVVFSAVRDHEEDAMTVRYLRDTCLQAGLATEELAVEDIGWDSRLSAFVDLKGSSIEACFKLYPWEWMMRDEFASQLSMGGTRFLEPAWKMLLSNKAILPILWELFPDHPNLLPAFFDAAPLGGAHVRKPILGREGANVVVTRAGQAVHSTEGCYGEEPVVYQALAPIPCLDGCFPVFGAWIVDHEPAGLGIREDSSIVTGNLSRFVPHFFTPLSS